ncbi:hypothetical protein FQA47_001337 [Oryzias melastigma]|uniref:Uncharacterized protein n=1 Tax=Oryzias melastigma TaxID=30732 RepID=A0A834FI47_ORYME|nr:hypothetical protein FQA47_001336 [Oryzias melastigma]KAF6734573.1 hypothetical protein FQA47_001337 [Oryzias melastigma]
MKTTLSHQAFTLSQEGVLVRKPQSTKSRIIKSEGIVAMSSVESLREFISERLDAAAERILARYERTLEEYEKTERRQRQTDISRSPQVEPHSLDVNSQDQNK